MFHAPSFLHLPAGPDHADTMERARKVARFAVQPRLAGAFARAAYHGALEVAARLAAAPTPDPQRALLADMYIHWQHAVPYRIADAGLATQMEGAPLRALVTCLCRQGIVQRATGAAPRRALRPDTRIELSAIGRAELSGQYAHIHSGAITLVDPPRQP